MANLPSCGNSFTFSIQRGLVGLILTMAISPVFVSGCIPPEVPTRMKISAPILISSSTAIAVEGQPIPVETTETDVSEPALDEQEPEAEEVAEKAEEPAEPKKKK